jgi:hypothetical protein
MDGETWVALVGVIAVIVTVLVNLWINRGRNETREVRFENLTAELVRRRFPKGPSGKTSMSVVGVDSNRDQKFIALVAGEPPSRGTFWQRQ